MKQYTIIKDLQKQNRKMLAVLIDPDDDLAQIAIVLQESKKHKVDFIFLGGSLLSRGTTHKAVELIKQHLDIPILLFPGDEYQFTPLADGILLLSLISGRNAEYLIGKHVLAAPLIKMSGIEVLPTGYILVENKTLTAVHYMSQTLPIPANKPELAAVTALAGEMLGLKLMYLDSGSGAQEVISSKMISAIRKAVDCPIIVGGGIKDVQTAKKLYDAGADILVVGNAAASNNLIADIKALN